VALYTGGSIAGGAITGALIGTTGALVDRAGGVVETLLTGAAVAVAAAAIVLELLHRVAPLPERHRQVPREWVNWRHRSLTGAAFGLMIGAGALTFLEHATAYVLAVLIFLGPGAGVGGAVGAVYGATRALPLITTWAADRRGTRRLNWEALFRVRDVTPVVLVAASLTSAALAVLIGPA
jgi:hypothetical protein